MRHHRNRAARAAIAVAAFCSALTATAVLATITETPQTAAAGGVWSDPSNLSVAGQAATQATVAADPDGNVFAAWQRFNGSHTVIQAARWDATKKFWGPALDLSAAGGNAKTVDLASNSFGDVIAVWQRHDGMNTVVQASRFDPATKTWGAPANLSAPGQDAAPSPKVNVDGSGNAMAVWTRSDGTDSIVQAARHVKGSPSWGAPVNVSASGGDASQVSMGFSSSGHGLVVWRRNDGLNHIAQEARFFAPGTWTAPKDLSLPGHDASFPVAAFDNMLRGIVVWQRFNGSNAVIQSSHLAFGSWSAPVNRTPPGQSATDPHLAVSESGTGVLTWSRFNGAVTVIQAAPVATYTDDFGTTTTLSGATGVSASTPRAAADRHGNGTVVWQRPISGQNVIQSARYTRANEAWSQTVNLSNVLPVGSASVASAASDEEGHMTAVWQKVENGVTRIQSARYTRGFTVWTDKSMADPTHGVAYDDGVAASGSPEPTYSIIAGALPAGLSLDANTGKVTGIPSVTGMHWFTVRATNEESFVTTVINITVAPAPAATTTTVADATTTTSAPPPSGPGATTTSTVPSATPTNTGPGGGEVGFVAVDPVRVFDTRSGESPAALRQVAKARVGGESVLEVQVTDLGGVVPVSGVGAVSLNVAVTNPAADGFITVYPCGPRRLVASVNFVAGQTVSNAVLAPVSATGTVCFYSLVATDVVVDLNGWFPAGATYHAMEPQRMFDTRGERANVLTQVPVAEIGGSNELEIRIEALPGLAAGTVAGAVSLNVAVTNPRAAGFVTVYPCGTRPFVASVNYLAGQTVSNAVVAPVSANGTICFYSHVPTDLIVDINSWFDAGSSFAAAGPVRLFDTRPGESPSARVQVAKVQFGHETVIELKVTDLDGVVPGNGVGAVALNVTVTNPNAAGFITVYPCGARPLVASVNYIAGQTVPNAVIAPVSAIGTVCFYSHATTDLVVDLNGWFTTTT